MIGKTILHYNILEKLGEGGMGVVYKAEDTKLQRTVAIKFLPQDLTRNAEAKHRFIHEARTASALDHPNICTIHEINETDDGQLFIVMAYYDDESLKQKIEQAPLNSAEAINIALQVAEGLKKAHSKGIIHRDIKPSNIMITSDGIVKIVDFGLAKLVRGQRLTVDGKTMGTIAYMSPEQTRGDDVDERSDIWSLGVVIYEMLTGKLPFRGEYEQAVIYSIVNEEPEPLSKIIPEIDESFQQLLDKMLNKKLDDRYQTATELIQNLAICRTPGAENGLNKLFAFIKSVQTKRAAAKIRRWLISVAAFLLVFLIALTAYWLTSKSKPQVQLSDKVFAIFPFTARGEQEFGYLQEGMVDLLSMDLNGAGDLRSVDPRAILNQVKLIRKEEPDLNDARNIARHFGAGFYIMGSIFVVKDRLRFNAMLYVTNGDENSTLQISTEGTADQLYELVDGIGNQIIAKCSSTPADRMQLLGSMTTQSLPALKAYLEGLQAIRKGLFTEAVDLYTRAVQLDTSFAMAWFQLSLVNFGMFGRYEEAQNELQRAFHQSDKLSQHDLLYLKAWQAILNGENEKAMDLFRQIVAKYPDDIFGWDNLESYWSVVANLYGHSLLECRDAAKRWLALDPENANVYQQILIPALRRGHLPEIDSLIARLKQLGPEHSWGWSSIVPRAYLVDDTSLRQQALQEALQQNYSVLCAGIGNSAQYGKNFKDVIPLARTLLDSSRPHYEQAGGYLMLAILEMGRGRWQVATKKLDSLSIFYPKYGQVFQGLFSSFYYYHTGRLGLQDEYRKIVTCDAKTKPITFNTDTNSDWAPINNLAPQIRYYILGFLSYFMGDSSQTVLYCQRLLAENTPQEARSLIQIWAATVQALIAMNAHRDTTALKILMNEPVIMRFPLFLNAVYSTAFSRFLRAELLNRLGRYEEALNWYRSLTEMYFYDLPFRAPAIFRCAGINEKLGRRAEAIREYERFLEIWRDCDPEFKPMIVEAEKRLAALKQKK